MPGLSQIDQTEGVSITISLGWILKFLSFITLGEKVVASIERLSETSISPDGDKSSKRAIEKP